MTNNRVQALAGLAAAATVLIGIGSLLAAVILLFSTQWVAAGLCFIAASISFAALLQVLFR